MCSFLKIFRIRAISERFSGLLQRRRVPGIVLSKDCVDLYNPKVIRSTMGAIFRIPFIYTDDLERNDRRTETGRNHGLCGASKGKTPMIWKITRCMLLYRK